ncbi:MAG: NAD-dependent epimerase [Gammaproteobacteria bacterium]|nr:NAD-dependent epimerase [Gammaproteobacteria bacterium]
MKILVTGAAGFIGASLSHQLLERGNTVVGLDNLNDYYSVKLKMDRLERLQRQSNFHFAKHDLENRQDIDALFRNHDFDAVVNLAAQAGVRYSLENPQAYIDTNIIGFCNILEGCRYSQVKHLVFASSSSVYGANTLQPFSEHQIVDHPISLYAATKKANELMAHSYAHLYNLSVTGLRFFTVYGPWGRPDMALFKFTKNILNDEAIDVYNNGNMVRDFTYVDDIVSGLIHVIDQPATSNPDWSSQSPDPATSYAPYRIYNIGNANPVPLLSFIKAIENATGKKARITNLPMQPGDVPSTYADTRELQNAFNFKPETSIQEGIDRFVQWYREYFEV